MERKDKTLIYIMLYILIVICLAYGIIMLFFTNQTPYNKRFDKCIKEYQNYTNITKEKECFSLICARFDMNYNGISYIRDFKIECSFDGATIVVDYFGVHIKECEDVIDTRLRLISCLEGIKYD